MDDPEYIREQARKQLNLLNPGEILFLFDDEQGVEEVQEPEATEKTEQTEDAGGSDG